MCSVMYSLKRITCVIKLALPELTRTQSALTLKLFNFDTHRNAQKICFSSCICDRLDNDICFLMSVVSVIEEEDEQ